MPGGWNKYEVNKNNIEDGSKLEEINPQYETQILV